MKAVSYESKGKMAVSSRAMPTLKASTDALLRVTTSGICGSDLHMYDGRTPLKKGTVVGHEIMGVIDEVGDAVKSIKRGDRVVLPFNISCGFCHGEEKRKGVDCVIDAVGYQARDDKAPSREKSTQVLENCLRAVNSTGHLAIIGLYLAPDPGAKDSLQ